MRLGSAFRWLGFGRIRRFVPPMPTSNISGVHMSVTLRGGKWEEMIPDFAFCNETVQCLLQYSNASRSFGLNLVVVVSH